MNAHNNLALRAAAHPDRVGYYQHTAPTGKKYWPLDPRPDEVYPEVIAHHLATRARYNGATQHREHIDRIFYSVAEHSVYCSWYVERDLGKPEFALEALLHDSSEAYNGDLIRPLKYDARFREPFMHVEGLNEAAHAVTFNLIYPYPAEVKIADEAVCAAEVNQIIIKDASEEWESGKLHDDSRVAPYSIRMLPPYQAKTMFIRRFNELIERRPRYRSLPSRIAALSVL